ncbi:mitochondrial enolase superfamily member 1 [Grus japonensis]|uniref:Mitochondrial enolase superfamily member 1 n=1 Tax=Grus japonensis TaxID=30415 RepID=A0ABC9VSB6_GRUJA
MKVVVTGNSQHGFTQSESCLTNLMAIYDKIIGLVEKRRPVDAIHLDFSKAFNAISHNIPVSEYTEDGWTTIQETKWLGDGAQRVVVNGLHSTWTSVTSGVPQGSILEHNLCNIFANNLKEATECPLVRYAAPELEDRDGEQNEAPITQGEMVSNLLHHLRTYKSMGLDGIHPRVLRELVEMLAKPLSSIYQQSWLTGEVPVDWRLASVTPIYKKGWKEDPGNYKPVSLTSVPGKVMEQIISSAITRHIQDNQVIRPSQRGFMKGRSCLTNLIFYDKVTCLVDERKAMDVIYLDFSKAFDIVSQGSSSPVETGCSWLGQAYSSLGKKLAGWPGPKSCGEWS